MSSIEDRLREAEEIIRAQNQLIQAMHYYVLEDLWPKEATVLQGTYEQQYGVDLSAGEIE